MSILRIYDTRTANRLRDHAEPANRFLRSASFSPSTFTDFWPDVRPHVERAAGAGFTVRRAEPWDRDRMRQFATQCFGELWAVEADRAFNHSPITGFVATRGPEVVGFGVYECTRRGFFGPTGVREALRGHGLGTALLLLCLESMRELGYAYAVI